MKKVYLSLVLAVSFLFSGCATPKPCEPITITKKCEAKKPKCQELTPESGDIIQWTKARLENYPKLQSCLYDFEAALERCL